LLLNEIAAGATGLAHRWVRRNAGPELWVSPVTLAEVLEGGGTRRPYGRDLGGPWSKGFSAPRRQLRRPSGQL